MLEGVPGTAISRLDFELGLCAELACARGDDKLTGTSPSVSGPMRILRGTGAGATRADASGKVTGIGTVHMTGATFSTADGEQGGEKPGWQGASADGLP